jgi:hypothetical protein
VTFGLPDPDKLVEVFGAFDLTLVSMARDALESVEIESFTFDEHASHMGYGGGRPARSSDGIRGQSRRRTPMSARPRLPEIEIRVLSR